jgi:hypothetical protein
MRFTRTFLSDFDPLEFELLAHTRLCEDAHFATEAIPMPSLHVDYACEQFQEATLDAD